LEHKSKAFETAVQLIQAELIAEKVTGKLNNGRQPVIEKPPEKLEHQSVFKTEFVDSTETVNGTLNILDENGQGRVEKLLVRSPSPNFGIIVALDGEEQLHGNYSDFQDVFAYQEDSTYVLELTRIHFARSITVTLTTTAGPVNFSRLFIKYSIKRPNR
jgi:hypothetical protein